MNKHMILILAALAAVYLGVRHFFGGFGGLVRAYKSGEIVHDLMTPVVAGQGRGVGTMGSEESYYENSGLPDAFTTDATGANSLTSNVDTTDSVFQSGTPNKTPTGSPVSGGRIARWFSTL